MLLKDGALNYELGSGMMWTGVCGIAASIFLFGFSFEIYLLMYKNCASAQFFYYLYF